MLRKLVRDRADLYRLFKYRGGCTIPLFQLSVWCEKFVPARHYAVIWKQLLFANKRNRVRWVVLGLSQDGACTDLFENFSENSLKRNLSNDTTVTPPLFSLVNTFKEIKWKAPVTWRKSVIICGFFGLLAISQIFFTLLQRFLQIWRNTCRQSSFLWS